MYLQVLDWPTILTVSLWTLGPFQLHLFEKNQKEKYK